MKLANNTCPQKYYNQNKKGKHMKIIEPIVEIEKADYEKMMKNLERACRTCYRSEEKITETSYKTLLKNCINRGHESVLEHEKSQ